MAFAFLSLASLASADTLYRWRDGADRLHFSNRPQSIPSSAEAVKLPQLGFAKGRPIAAERPPSNDAEPASDDVSEAPAFEPSDCDVADAGPLVDAITSRLEAMRPDGSADPKLTLIVAGTPVSYSSTANVQVLEGGESDETAASEQAALAYSGGGGCPRTALERYAVGSSDDGGSSSGLCRDYRRAARELEVALRRNASVVPSFDLAAARYDSSIANEEQPAGIADLDLPPWLMETGAAQTAELAGEVEDFLEELTVAREEIDRAAEAQGCW